MGGDEAGLALGCAANNKKANGPAKTKAPMQHPKPERKELKGNVPTKQQYLQ